MTFAKVTIREAEDSGLKLKKLFCRMEKWLKLEYRNAYELNSRRVTISEIVHGKFSNRELFLYLCILLKN
jgi:hypothetical protein